MKYHCWNDNGHIGGNCENIHSFNCGGIIKEKKMTKLSYILCEYSPLKKHDNKVYWDKIVPEPIFYGSNMIGNIDFIDILLPEWCPKINEFNQLKLF